MICAAWMAHEGCPTVRDINQIQVKVSDASSSPPFLLMCLKVRDLLKAWREARDWRNATGQGKGKTIMQVAEDTGDPEAIEEAREEVEGTY